MPVQYSSILAEHRSVREAAGLFDLCHMGEIRVSGPGALDFLQRIATNDASRLAVGQSQYSLLCNQTGGVIDDILVYRLPEDYLLVVNAANTDADYAWMVDHLTPKCRVENVSFETGMLALQGPLAAAVLQPFVDVDLATILYFRHRQGAVRGINVMLSRTGYTGEDGFELFCERNDVTALWEILASIENGPTLCGLGARDTLRLEAALPLYGHELDENTNPYEARLGWVVKLEKTELIGREALLAVKNSGARRQLVGLEILDRAIARVGFSILKGGQVIGRITSGTFSPTLERSIALGYLPTEMANAGVEILVDVRGRQVAAHVVPIPFYKRKK